MDILLEKEYSKKVISLAYPVVLGMVARTVMGLVDAAMVGRLGAPQLAATGLGAFMVLWFVYSIGMMNIGVQAITSRRYGEMDYVQCGKIIHGTVVVVSLIGLSGSAAGFFLAPELFGLFTDDYLVYTYGKSYVAVRFLELFAYVLIGIYRGFFDGIGKTTVYMRSMLVMNGVNIVLNYLLIFGKFGFPRLEVTGAAIGSMISSYVGVAIVISSSFNSSILKRFSLYTGLKPDFHILKKLYRLSYPAMIQNFFAFLGFLFFLKIIGMIGTVPLAASNVCINITSVSFMPGVGIGIAAATLVGQNLGAKRPDLAEKLVYESVKLGMVFMGSLGVIFLLFPGTIMRLFTPDQAIINEGITALRIVGIVQFIDAVGIILGNCLQGAGMTKYVMIIELICIWIIFIPATYILGIVMGMLTAGAWIGLAIYILFYAIIMSLSFRLGKWKMVTV
ncbi:MATE family efflux transporter [candidate division KSB1 bacterium]